MNIERLPRATSIPALFVFFLAFALTACDRGGRLAQSATSTPQAPLATPMLLGITTEAPNVSAPTPADDSPPPQPTATYDPSRPAWTFLYYAGADNGRAAYVWDDLNEMEAAGPTDQVQVIAQVDWPEGGPAETATGRRYRIQPDEDRSAIASEVVAELGETNQGDPATLADFLAWGMATYPANHYVLVLGDFGGGWMGCCLDDAAGAPGQSDFLSLADLDQALALAASQAGGPRLDVIAFAAGLMGQLDVLQAVQPYADFAVASPGLIPGSTWDLQPVLTQLNAEPLITGRQLAGDLVTAFVNTQRQLQGDEFISMAAIDLGRVPAMTEALEAVAGALAADPNLRGAIAADARRGAQAYGSAVLVDGQPLAVDLLHAMAILSEYSPPGDLQNAAAAAVTATSESLVAFDHGLGVPAGRGIAIYWPAVPDPEYVAASRLPAWANWLSVAPQGPPSTLTLDGGQRETVHIAQPALMKAELIARQVSSVSIVADQEAADGRRVLRQLETVQPAPLTLPGGTNASLWLDGRHESLIIWDATGPYLFEASGSGDYVPLRTVDYSPSGAQVAATGWFRRGGSETELAATITFDEASVSSNHVWAITAAAGAQLIGEVRPVPGDTFRPAVYFVGPDGQLTTEPGAPLAFDEMAAIYRSTRPLPSGRYSVGLRALDGAVTPRSATKTLTVDNAAAPPGYRAFVDAAHDVQFPYPSDWPPPLPGESQTATSNISGTVQLEVRYLPGWTADLKALQEETLGTFGDVSVLLDEPVEVGQGSKVAAIHTAYGYDSPQAGARTGTFLTFLRDATGYVVDLDGPREAESDLLAILDTVANGWQFLPPRLGFGPEPVSTLNLAGFRIQYPSGYAYQEFNNWHRFTADSQTFAAVRIQPAARTPDEAMSGLRQVASEGVTDFTAGEAQSFYYAGHVWVRSGFTYAGDSGNQIRGLLLSRQDGDMEVSLWAEAPESSSLTEDSILPIAASIQRIPAAPAG